MLLFSTLLWFCRRFHQTAHSQSENSALRNEHFSMKLCFIRHFLHMVLRHSATAVSYEQEEALFSNQDPSSVFALKGKQNWASILFCLYTHYVLLFSSLEIFWSHLVTFYPRLILQHNYVLCICQLLWPRNATLPLLKKHSLRRWQSAQNGSLQRSSTFYSQLSL